MFISGVINKTAMSFVALSVNMRTARQHISGRRGLSGRLVLRIIGLRIIGKLRLFFGIEVIEIAVEFVEPMRGGKKLILVAKMVLAPVRFKTS
jgi:hypothetical protein